MKSRLKADSWVLNAPIAHRGLHGNGLAENSYSAYAKAIENGYPIEMDVQQSVDGVLFCFHDDSLQRVTGENALIWDKTADELLKLKLSGTTDGIPLFDDFLKFVNGKVPLLIEIKQQRDKNSGIEEKIVKALDNYHGEFAVQSFDPFIMKKIRKLRPDFLRGQLGGGAKKSSVSFFKRIVVNRLLLNCLSKPDFINYYIGDMPRKFALPTILWTVRTVEDEVFAKKMNCNIVFEKIIPSAKND